jgi:arsenate reductase
MGEVYLAQHPRLPRRDALKVLSAKTPLDPSYRERFLREADAKAAGLAESASDTDVFAAMAENPKLIQRPIGVNGGKAVLGRPNAKLLDIV